jgi:DNA-binding PadR family transcriptional regulator
MYRDNTLIPSETVRLLALGLLADGEKRYGELASEVRYFTSHVVGPSLDLVAPPLELLKVEGLIEAVDSVGTSDDTVLLRITEIGRAELIRLLTANLRAPVNDINKLILALKMRFLHVLEPAEQRLQVEVLVEMSERELARLTELRDHHAQDESGFMAGWLEHDIAEVATRLEWFQELDARIG